MKRSFMISVMCLMFLPTSPAMACLTIPTPAKIITSIYGWRFQPTLHYWRMHRGDDMRAAVDTQLVAAQDGVVQLASSASGGNELRIVGSNGVVVRYLHLTHALVTPGAHVSAGQVIALSGNTGNESAAAHLHFEVYEGGHDVNPEGLFCAGTSRKAGKAGANMSHGFPVLACKPNGQNGGTCSNQVKSLPPVSSPSTTSAGNGTATSTSNPATATSATTMPPSNQPPPPAPNVGAFDDMSTMEILSSEVAKRFANPDWYKETAERSSIPLLIDYLHMAALSESINLQKKMLRDRIEMMLATRLARESKIEMAKRLARQRQAAAVVGGQSQ